MSVTLADLERDLKAGRVWECSLRDPKLHIEGLQDGQNIYIDPRPAILEVLLHELLHRVRPTWSERYVLKMSRRIFLRMTDADKARLWRTYNRIKRKGVPVDA